MNAILHYHECKGSVGILTICTVCSLSSMCSVYCKYMKYDLYGERGKYSTKVLLGDLENGSWHLVRKHHSVLFYLPYFNFN